jgi:dolichyl-phosphate-mannose-protein mannosyltransferase
MMRHRMASRVPGNMFLGWAGPLVVIAIGAFLRLYRLAVPHAIVFDESTYVPDAYSILRHGTELQAVRNANALLLAGNTHILLQAAQASVHPPFGKIMIASGIWRFGLAPFGWRFAVAVAGSLAILMAARITRRMTRSTLLGCIAGLLLALDGLEFVLSRTALLDVFMFWVLAAFGLLVIDWDRTRARIADAAPCASGLSPWP